MPDPGAAPGGAAGRSAARGFRVREATEADLEGLLDLVEAVAAEGRWLAAEPPVDRASRGELWRAVIRGERPGAAFVAVPEPSDPSAPAATHGEVIGSLGLEPTSYGVASLGMMVAEAWRRRGVGRALMDAAFAWARQAGMHKISLEVWPHNHAARALYRSMGFVEEGYLRAHYPRRSGELWDVVVMGLVLRPDKTPE
jgi:RimJ/RimL family protein N-acetyltransferase